MTVLAPAWLILLLPWVALTWWMLTRRGERAVVPYVELWRTDEVQPARTSSQLHVPPLPVLFVLIALLLSVLAAARPAVVRNGSGASGPATAPATPPVKSVSIVRVAARATPRPAVLVRVRNQSDRKSAELRVASDGEPMTRSIELPPEGQERDYFVDLPRMGESVSVELGADGRARLVRNRAWPKIEPATSLAPELQRMIEVYGKHRPASEGSMPVVVTDDLSSIGSGRAAAGVGRADQPVQPGSLQVIEHPVTAHVRWDDVIKDATVARPPPRDGWTPVVSVGSTTLMAVRESPARQVWVGFALPAFARHPDFVVLWTNVFDWIAAGGDGSAADEFNALAEPSPQVDSTRPTTRRLDVRMTEFTSGLLIAATLAILAAVASWTAARDAGAGVP